MITFIKSLYDKTFYNEIVREFHAYRFIRFVLVLYVFVAALSFSLVSTLFSQLDELTEMLPRTWVLEKTNGLSVFDKNGESVSKFQDDLIQIDLNKVTMTEKELKGVSVFFTKRFMYYKKSYEFRHHQINFDDILKDNRSLTLVLTKKASFFYKKIQVFQNKKLIRDVPVWAYKIAGLVVLLIGVIGGFPFLILAMLLIALIYAALFKIVTLIFKKDIVFFKLFMLSIFIQSWFVVLYLLRLMIIPIPYIIIFLSVFLLGLVVIFKFLEVNPDTPVQSS